MQAFCGRDCSLELAFDLALSAFCYCLNLSLPAFVPQSAIFYCLSSFLFTTFRLVLTTSLLSVVRRLHRIEIVINFDKDPSKSQQYRNNRRIHSATLSLASWAFSHLPPSVDQLIPPIHTGLEVDQPCLVQRVAIRLDHCPG